MAFQVIPYRFPHNHRFPESILKTIDLNNLELQNGTYISKKLEETRSDLLFRTTINQKEAQGDGSIVLHKTNKDVTMK